MTQSLSTPMQEVVVHSGESLERVFLSQPVDLRITQEAGSRVRLHVLDFEGVNAHIEIDQVGEGCDTEIYGLCYLRSPEKGCPQGREGVIHTAVRHLVGGGRSSQLIKFALDGEAKGEFFGQLYIAPDAQQTEAYQTNRNLLLSDDARMRTRPQLEIYADDVRASHGATTGRLDESSLFYMQQRCIDPEKGRKLLLEAFLREVTDTISDRESADALDRIIEQI